MTDACEHGYKAPCICSEEEIRDFNNRKNKTTDAEREKDKDIEWIGHPMISDNDPYTPSNAWLPGVQIGLRKDGVVVWREVKNERNGKGET